MQFSDEKVDPENDPRNIRTVADKIDVKTLLVNTLVLDEKVYFPGDI